MKTFWTNLPLTIRAAVIFCYGYASGAHPQPLH